MRGCAQAITCGSWHICDAGVLGLDALVQLAQLPAIHLQGARRIIWQESQLLAAPRSLGTQDVELQVQTLFALRPAADDSGVHGRMFSKTSFSS